MRLKKSKYKAHLAFQRMIVSALFITLIVSSIPTTTALWEKTEYDDEVKREEQQVEFKPDSASDITPSEPSLDKENKISQNQDQFLHVHLKAATFDPKLGEPDISSELKYSHVNGYYLVQIQGPIRSKWIDDIKTSGALILGYIPEYTYLIHMENDAKQKIEDLAFIRWIGIYHPAYKIQTGLLEKTCEIELNVLIFRDKQNNLPKVISELEALGGVITREDESSHIIRVRTDAANLRSIAFIPEVQWIDEYTEPFALMNNVRIFTGAENLHSNGFNGSGIVGEVKDDGCDLDHPDFEGQIIGTDGDPSDGAHGTCTFGIVFSSGENDNNAMGMMPGGQGVFSTWDVERNESIENLVNNWGGVFQSNSWSSGSSDSTYTSISQENDEAVFYHDVTMLYAAGNSNSGVGPESLTKDSVAKNVICVGAWNHFDDTDRTNDRWENDGSGMTPSQGPAADGRIKPDLSSAFDWIYTTDSVDGDGNDGYASGNYYEEMGGTSGATPIAAGSAGLVYQMYKENFFGNNPSNTIPHAATVKAILIADAYQYEFSQADRFQQGWGGVDVGNVYEVGLNHFIVDEEVNLMTGENVSYFVAPTGYAPMKISLVWTDVPGVTSSSQHLVNNLDLKVTDPYGTVYYGNAGLITSKWSSSGGSYDTLNNVENVFIENPEPGSWTIEVIAQNIAMDGDLDTPEIDQNFALVASEVLQAEHDLGVSEIQVDDYLAPNEVATVSATVFNNGLSDENDVVVNLKVDGQIEDTTLVTEILSGHQILVSFDWIPPTGIYMVGIEVEPVADENFTANNYQEKQVIAEPDIAVTDIITKKYFKPDTLAQFNTTLQNLGKVDLTDVVVQLLVNGTLKDNEIITSFASESSQPITLEWTPTDEGWYAVEIYALPVEGEELVADNKVNTTVLVTSKEPVFVAVLDSWGTDFHEDAPWDYINENWMYFGTTPVEIDYQTLNKNDITYDDLAAKNADVLLISSAYSWEFTDSEIDAITTYVQQGHGLVATSLTLFHFVPNNNDLAPLFGMRDDLSYEVDSTTTLNLMEPLHPLYNNIPDPYTPGTEATAIPPDFSWDADDLIDGRYVALSSDSNGAIIVNKGLVYISHWIEYESNSDDIQLFYNAFTWSKYEREQRDVTVMNIQVPSYLSPNQDTFVNATIVNIGLNDETDITVNFTVDGSLESQTVISNLASGDAKSVSFMWTAPSNEGQYLVEIATPVLPDENVTGNNFLNTSILVSNGPIPGTIGLISDGNQLQSVTSILNDLGKPFAVLDNNAQSGYTSDISVLLLYQIVIFFNENRAIDDTEKEALEDYIALGGVLLVTGYDSLGSPNDPLLADLVRSTVFGDNMGENTFIVRNGSHPIMDGIFGQFPTGSQFSVGETDHDAVEADTSRGAQTVAELSDGFDKIIATELSSGGKVIYWNGNRDVNDWTDADLSAMFKNFIVWFLPIYNDVRVLNLNNPSEVFVGDSVDMGTTCENTGKNDQSDFAVLLEIKNFYGFTIFSEYKENIILNSGESTYLEWQWVPSYSGFYSIEITTLLVNDEVAENDMISSQITVYTRFFTDNMESGEGDWESSTSSLILDPIWHLTTSDSYSPTTSWWCADEDLLGQYTVVADQYLTSPVIDLIDATSVILIFHHRYSIDDFPFIQDWGYVEISADGGGWESLDSYSGTLNPWSEEVIDISGYVGHEVQIRFYLSSGVVLTDNGWWVDDVEIYGMGNQYDIELTIIDDVEDVGKDESAFYEILVKNNGNAMGSVDLSIDGTNVDEWDVSFDQNGFQLLPGDTDMVTLTITPQSSEHGDYHANVIGDLKLDSTVKDSDSQSITLTVNQWFGIDLETQNFQLDFIPDETRYYNITVINQGNGPDSFSLGMTGTESGISSGWQYDLDETLVMLNAFQQTTVLLSVTNPENARLGDRIIIDITGTSYGDQNQRDTLQTLSITIGYFSIDVNTSQTDKETPPEVAVPYTVTVTNFGNTQVIVDLDISPIVGTWYGWITDFSVSGFSLGAFAIKIYSFSITPPDTALAYDYKEFAVTALSPNSVSELTIKTFVALSGELDLVVPNYEKEGQNSASVQYIITVSNTQNHEDTIDITATSNNDWNIDFLAIDGSTKLSDSDGDGFPDTGVLNPWDDTLDVVVEVKIPGNAQAYTQDEATVTFHSSLPAGDTKSVVLKSKVELSGNIILETEPNSKTDDPGKEVTYLVSVQNNYNYQAVIDLSASSSSNWEVVLLNGDGNIHLRDTNNNRIPDTGSMPGLGEITEIMVLVSIPDNAVAYTQDIITIAGTTPLSDDGHDSIELSTGVQRIYDVDIDSHEQEFSVIQGKELIFTIELSNNGNWEEELDIRFRELPEGWSADFSNDNPSVPLDGSRVISISMNIPSDAEPGIYFVTISTTSADGIKAGDITLTIDVDEEEEEFDIPYVWIFLMILIICGIIAAILVLRRTGARQQPALTYSPGAQKTAKASGIVFPRIEMISCPDCSYVFEMEVTHRPFKVQCPNCGTSGIMR